MSSRNSRPNWTSAADSLSGELEQMRRRKQQLEREIENLANFVAQGDCSPGLRAALVDREREIGDITGKLLDARRTLFRRSFEISEHSSKAG
jgi:hypothetical protein